LLFDANPLSYNKVGAAGKILRKVLREEELAGLKK
jgi:hypothetical protein